MACVRSKGELAVSLDIKGIATFPQDLLAAEALIMLLTKYCCLLHITRITRVRSELRKIL